MDGDGDGDGNGGWDGNGIMGGGWQWVMGGSDCTTCMYPDSSSTSEF